MMAGQKKCPEAVAAAQGAQDATRIAYDRAQRSALLRTFTRVSRHHCSVVVAGSGRFKELGKVLNNEDACRVVANATRIDAGFVVLAGKLHETRSGCLGMIIIDRTDLDSLESAVVATYDRLSDLGETDSMWLVALEGEIRVRVEAVLASLSATEGAA